MSFLFETDPNFRLNAYAENVVSASTEKLQTIAEEITSRDSFKMACALGESYIGAKDAWLETQQESEEDEVEYKNFHAAKVAFACAVARMFRHNTLTEAERSLGLITADLDSVLPDMEACRIDMWATKTRKLLTSINSMSEGSWEKMANELSELAYFLNGFIDEDADF